jgi:hypothetical protein
MDFQVMVVMPNCQLATCLHTTTWTPGGSREFALDEDEYRGIIVLRPRGQQYKPELD